MQSLFGVQPPSGGEPEGPQPMARQLAFLGTFSGSGNIEQCSTWAAACARPAYQRIRANRGVGGSQTDSAPATIETLVGAPRT
jgi:hypothetical protein